MRVILGKGANSTVFTDDAEPGIVIKEPNRIEKDSGYFSRQAHGYKIIDMIRAQNPDTGVLLPELIEIKDTGDKQFLKEKIIPGQVVTTNMYNALSEKQKNSIAKQMATFLNVMHSSAEYHPARDFIINMKKNGPQSADEIIAKFDGRLPHNIANKLQQAEEYLRTTDTSDEVVVMTHKDIRTQNLMYDAKTDKLAVLDFEMAGPDNVYRDFIANAPSWSMPWDFTKRVIDYYNKITDKKYPIKINPKKVQNMLLYGILHEYARNIRPGDNERATDRDFITISNLLELVTGMNFDTKQLYENAMKKVRTMGTPEQKNIVTPNIEREDR